ncbi:MAG TPA: hypothetical protein DCO79_10565 [Spirochaeta sp.]|nr:hypothetical protein [Spirochaeta sp.]
MFILYIFLSIVIWLEVLICFTVYIVIQAILFITTAAFDKHRKIMHYNTSILCTVVLALCPLIRVKYTGRENIDRSKPSVIVMNHQSIIDILLVFTLYKPAKMIAKKVLSLVPFVGWNLFMSGHIFIDRASRKSQIEAIRRMDDILIDGDSLMIFPEGTRTKDGEIAEYKKGAFRSACNSGTSVLPVVIDGAFQALPRKGVILNGFHKIKISILPPITVEKGSPTAGLALKCHDIMSAELERMRLAF